MSGSDRGNRSKASLATKVAIAIGAAAIVGGITYGLFKQAGYQESANQQATDYAKYAAKKGREACVGLSRVEQVHCLAKEQAEYDLKTRDNHRDYDDLVAQRKSALWTFIMGVAALIGMGLSIVGVVLVKKTFDATKDSNEIAKKTAREQLRPYVYLEVECVTNDDKGKIGSYDDGDRVSIHVRNYGQTPAKSVSMDIACDVRRYDSSDYPPDFSGWRPIKFNDIPPLTNTWYWGFRLRGIRGKKRKIMTGDLALHIDGLISYDDAHGNSYETQFRMVSFGEKFQGRDFTMSYHGNRAT